MNYQDADGVEWRYEYASELYDADKEIVYARVINTKTGESFVRGWKRAEGEPDLSVWIEMIRRSKSLFGKDPETWRRRAYRVLAMVREFHAAGFQRLRIEPSSSPSGCYWRCRVAPKEEFLASNGALCREEAPWIAVYSTGSDNQYFGWEDAAQDTAKDLAAKFMQRYPDIVRRSEGRDWEYAGWYEEMLHRAREGGLPLAYFDSYDGEAERRGFLTLSDHRLVLPMPPGGDWQG